MSIFKYLSNAKYFSLSVFVLLLSSTSFAEEPDKESLRLLAKYDANGDHVISLTEVEDKRKRIFGRMDSDSDGDVSFDEYEQLDKAKRTPILKARFDKLDLDHDGRLSGTEYASYLGSFDRLDQNSDGQLSGSEMQKTMKKQAEKPKREADLCLLWVCVRKDAF